MSQKTLAQLTTDINTQLATNNANLITAAILRGVLIDMADSAENLVDGDFGGYAIFNFLGTVKTTTANTYATIDSDTGKIVELIDGTGVAVTLHKAAPIGHNCVFTQMGAGQLTFAPEGGGGIMRSYNSLTKTAGQYAVVSAYVRTNSGGSAAEWVLSGTMA
jgi:hypothetical protein